MNFFKMPKLFRIIIPFLTLTIFCVFFFQNYNFSRTELKTVTIEEKISLLDKKSNDAMSYLEISWELFLDGDVIKSKEYYAKGRTKGFKTVEEFYMAGWISDHFFNFEEARQNYFNAYRLDPSNRTSGFMFILDNIVLSKNDSEELLDVFIKKNSESEFSEVIIKLQEQFKKHSGDIELRKNLFYIFAENSFYPQAIGIGRTLLTKYQIRNNNWGFFYDLGKLELENRNGREAKNIFTILLKLQPNNSDFQLGLAESYLLEENPEGLKLAQLAVENNQNTYSLTLLGMANALEGEIHKAKYNLERALNMADSNGRAYFQLGKIYENEDEHKAQELYLKALDSEGLNIYEIIYVGKKINNKEN